MWKKPDTDVLPGDTHLHKFTLSARLPDKPFTLLFLPTLQHCRGSDGTEAVHEWVGTSTEHHGLIQQEPDTQVLDALHPGTEI